MLESAKKEGRDDMAFSDKKAAFKYINDYQREKYDRIVILRKKGDKDKIKAYADSKGLKVTEFINQCIDEKLKRAGIDLNAN